MAPTVRLFARLDGADADSVTLTTDAGVVVPVAVEFAGDASGGAHWIVPDAPLAPGRYTVSVGAVGGGGRYEQQFAVTGSVDTAPPVAPALAVLGLGSTNPAPCDELIGGRVIWAPERGVAAESPAVIEIELLRGGVMFARVFPSDLYHFGTSPSPACFGTGQVEGLVDGEELTARVRAWDLAGNSTDWVESTFTVGRAQAAPENCASCNGAPGARSVPEVLGWALGLGFWLVWGRRHTRQPHGGHTAGVSTCATCTSALSSGAIATPALTTTGAHSIAPIPCMQHAATSPGWGPRIRMATSA